LWILGEYCESQDLIQSVMHQVRQALGEIPIVDDEIRRAAAPPPRPLPPPKTRTRSR